MEEEEVRGSRRISAALRREAQNPQAGEEQGATQQDGSDREPPGNGRRDARPTMPRPVLPTRAEAGTKPGARRRTTGIVLGVAVLIAISWAAWSLGRAGRPAANLSARPQQPPLALTLKPNGPGLRLEWTSSIGPVREASADVFDGDTVRRLDLTKDFGAQGAVQIEHKTGNVQAVVTAVDRSGRTWLASTGFTDSASVAHDMASTAQTEAAQKSGAEATGPATGKPRHSRRRRWRPSAQQ